MIFYNGSISKLRYFHAVCQYGTMTKAAEILNVSQPSLTLSIKELEKELGLTLFYRSKNTLLLTPQGEYVKDKTKEILQHFDDKYMDIIQYSGISEKRFDVGFPPIMGTLILPKLLKQIEQIPDNDITLRECTTPEAFQLLSDNIIQIAILCTDSMPKTYMSKTLLETSFHYWVDKSHPLSNSKSVSCSEINKYPLALAAADSHHNSAIISWFNQEKLTPNVKIYARQLSNLFNIIKNNNLGAITYKDIVAPDDDFVHIPLSPALPVNVNIVWKKEYHITQLQKKIINFLTHF